jgi:glycosyltransferase involved in cell wall biosynthesis
MVIAVDIRYGEEYQNFIFETFKRITAQHPSHLFIFIFDKPHGPSFIFSENITAVIIKPQKISLLNDLKISSLLKKYKADVFVTGKTLSQTKVPQCLIAYDNVTSGSLKKATVIVTTSEFSKKEIIEKYKITQDKIDVVYKGVNENFKPIHFKEKEKIKEQYANGNEYFLVAGTIPSENNFLNLLKAFSAFKKMQKSNMQLLIATDVAIAGQSLEKLRSFKFKDEVKLLEKLPEETFAAIMAGAYAFGYPFGHDYSFALQAMKCDTPLVVNSTCALPEICSDAALYVLPDSHKNIADKMMQIFKDEELRQQLIEKGSQLVKKYSWDNTVSTLWKSIEKACR